MRDFWPKRDITEFERRKTAIKRSYKQKRMLVYETKAVNPFIYGGDVCETHQGNLKNKRDQVLSFLYYADHVDVGDPRDPL